MDVYLDDCSDLWEELINDAWESIVVFTPFFDELLLDLFDNCNLNYENIFLVTQFDWIDSRAENLNRIFLAFTMMARGIHVRVVDRLHLKALVVDWNVALFGSQNFTRYSTSSVEITTHITEEDNLDYVFESFKAILLSSRVATIEELNEASGRD